MALDNIVVTGDSFFLHRHKFLYDALSERCQHLECIASGDVYDRTLSGRLVKAIYKRTPLITRDRALWWQYLHKRKGAFVRKSQQTEGKILSLDSPPDLVFHMFGMYAPFVRENPIPFTMCFDYTMALAVKTWASWSPFQSDKARTAWLEAEKSAYERAAHLFPWSNCVKQSLIEDYGISEQKMTVIGSSGNFRQPYDGSKSLGSRQLIFNGSDWKRKGGDLVLDAFRLVRQSFPEAKLVIVGTQTPINDPGVECVGFVSSASAMKDLFLASDLLLAPARCEPYGGFLVEGMNYGVPCIASNNGGMPDIVDHEVNGLVLQELTSEHLAGSIVSLLRDTSRLERYSRSSREKVNAQLNWDHVATMIFEALHRIDSPHGIGQH